MRQFVHVAEDQFALAARIAAIHHVGETPVSQQIADHAELVAGSRHRPQLERRRHHRQRVEAPRLPAGIVGGGFFQFDQVADAPGDHMASCMRRPVY